MANVGTLDVVLKGDTSHFNRNFAGAERQLNRMGGAADVASRKAGLLQNKMFLVGTAASALAIAGATSVRAYAELDDAMTRSLAIMDESAQFMRGEMAQAAREMARQTTFSATQAAESYFFLASAGLDAHQSLKALPVVAQFAQAGMFDLATATDLVTDAQSALGLTSENTAENIRNMTRVADVLVKANTLANASVEQFSQALTSEAANAMRTFGVSLEEGTSVLAAYADQGIKGNVAGTLFSRMLRLLTKAANENEEEFQRLGIRVFDTQGNLNSMVDIARDLTNALDGMATKQRVATLEALGFQARVQQSILPLLGAADKMEEYTRQLENAGGTAQRVADRNLESLSAQTKLLGSQIKDLAIGFGKVLAPAARVAVVALTELLRPTEFLSGVIERAVFGTKELERSAELDRGIERIERLKAEARKRAEERAARRAQVTEIRHPEFEVTQEMEEADQAFEQRVKNNMRAYERLQEVRNRIAFEEADNERRLLLLNAQRVAATKRLTEGTTAQKLEAQADILLLDQRIAKLREEINKEEELMRAKTQGPQLAPLYEVGSAATASLLAHREARINEDKASRAELETAANTKSMVELLDEAIQRYDAGLDSELTIEIAP